MKWQYASGEIILIIIGVTAALMVDEWRQARNDARLVDDYVVRLIQDLENEAIEWRRIDRAMLEKIEALDNALGWLSNPDQSTPAVSEFLTNLTVGSRMAYGSGAYIGSSTFEELIRTGRFGLIEDPDTRRALLTYYGWVETHRIRQISRQTEYAPTIYKLIPRDPEFQVQDDLSDA